jgi:hypothetical protein
MRSIVCILFLTILSGCKYERSFMNLNSDSGVPFLGLQMSVDARDSSRKSSDHSVITVAMSADRAQIPIQAESARAQSPQWVSIPASPSNAGHTQQVRTVSADEDPIAEIERRLSAF